MLSTTRTAVLLAAVFATSTVGFAQQGGTPGGGGGAAPPDATSNVERRRADLELAQNQLRAIQDAQRSKIETSERFMQARQEAVDAQRAFEAAKAPILEKLRASADYKRAQEDARLASERVEKANENASPTTQPGQNGKIEEVVDPKLLDAAQRKLDEKGELSKMETKALENDKDYVSAKNKFDDAVVKINAIRSEFQTALRADPAWIAARRDYERAQAAMTQPPAESTGGQMAGNSGNNGNNSNLGGTNRGSVQGNATSGVFNNGAFSYNSIGEAWWLYNLTPASGVVGGSTATPPGGTNSTTPNPGTAQPGFNQPNPGNATGPNRGGSTGGAGATPPGNNSSPGIPGGSTGGAGATPPGNNSSPGNPGGSTGGAGATPPGGNSSPGTPK